MDDSNLATSSASDHGQSPGLPRYLRWLVPLSVLMLLLLALLLALGFRVLVYGSQPIAATAADVAWRTARERETTLRQDLALLQEQWLGRQAQCPVVVIRPPEPGPEPGPGPAAGPGPEPGPGPILPPTMPPPPGNTGEVTPPAHPALPGDGGIGPAAGPGSGGTSTGSPSSDLPPPTGPENTLVLPPKPGNMEFLRGCWHSISGLVSVRDRRPVQIEYCFDDKGAGEVTVRSDTYVCKGKISASMQGRKKLVISTLGAVPCDNGSAFNPWQVVCRSKASGKAACQGVHSNKTLFDVTLLRK